MATLFLFLFAVISVALTYNVLRPNVSHPRYSVFSFLFGWLAGELALHVVLVQAVILLLVILVGELSGFWDAISVFLLAGSWGVLSYHYFSGYKAKALMAELVLPHQKAGEVSIWKRHEELDWWRLIRPFYALKDSDLKVEKNIVYAEVDGFRLKLDIRSLPSSLEKAPVLLQIHGGAWTKGYGSKNEQGLPLMQHMARQGWVSVSIDYRLSPKATFPDHIVDCKKALAWVKENIHKYGGDPKFIVATGGSAGGHLSSLLALSSAEKLFQPGFEESDTSIQGCVPFYGIYDLHDSERLQVNVGLEIVMRKSIIKQTKQENPELYTLMSPIKHVHKDAPPFLVIHGDKDSLTSLAEAQFFASHLDEVSAQSVEFAEVAGAQHAFDFFPSLRSDYVMLGIAQRIGQWHRDYIAQQR
jgi:acetyl esterase/lipase